jgi:hypothetical protein
MLNISGTYMRINPGGFAAGMTHFFITCCKLLLLYGVPGYFPSNKYVLVCMPGNIRLTTRSFYYLVEQPCI